MSADASVHRYRILVVDDEPANLELIHESLNGHYHLNLAVSGDQALQIIESGVLPDLVISDIDMPGIDGYELVTRLRENVRTCEVPVIFVTSHNSPVEESVGLDSGAADFISRPVNVRVLQARVRTQINLLSVRRELIRQAAALEAEVDERTAEIRQRAEDVRIAHESTIFALTSLAETRDNETGMHIRRVERYVRALIDALQEHPDYAADLADEQVRHWMAKAAPLHDIGKVGIPDAILLKPGKLSPGEWEVMRQHPGIGEKALIASQADAPGDPPFGGEPSFMRFAREIAGAHHEKWDGSGYPRGLSGEQIPLAARLMAVADVYDALISRRPYKAPFSHEQAVAMILEQSGTHFDPRVIDAFMHCTECFAEAASDLPDEELVPRQLEAR